MKTKNLGFKFYKLSLITFLMMIAAINYNLFINPAKIVAGGTNGIAVVFEKILRIDSSVIILITSVIILLICFIFKEYRLLLSAIYASLIYPFFVKIISIPIGFLNIKTNNLIVIAVFSGLISGLIAGLLCKFNLSQGGTTLLAQIISKKIGGSVSKINNSINIIIVIIGSFVFGFNNVMYATVYLVSYRIIMDKVILGISQRKLFQIITYEEDKVKDYIINGLNLSYTTFEVKGTSNKHNTKNRTVIMSSVINRDYYKLKEGIKTIDPNAFVLVTDSFEVEGGK